MFRVSFFCDDKHVADVHRFMVGRALLTPQPPEIKPVENVAANGTAKSSGGLCDLFQTFCQDQVNSGVTILTPATIKSFLQSHNFKASSITYALKCGKDYLRGHGAGNKRTYTITLAPTKPTKKVRRKRR